MTDMIDKLKNKLAGPLYKIEFPHTVTLTANEANALNAELHAQRDRIEALERENARLRERNSEIEDCIRELDEIDRALRDKVDRLHDALSAISQKHCGWGDSAIDTMHDMIKIAKEALE